MGNSNSGSANKIGYEETLSELVYVAQAKYDLLQRSIFIQPISKFVYLKRVRLSCGDVRTALLISVLFVAFVLFASLIKRVVSPKKEQKIQKTQQVQKEEVEEEEDEEEEDEDEDDEEEEEEEEEEDEIIPIAPSPKKQAPVIKKEKVTSSPVKRVANYKKEDSFDREVRKVVKEAKDIVKQKEREVKNHPYYKKSKAIKKKEEEEEEEEDDDFVVVDNSEDEEEIEEEDVEEDEEEEEEEQIEEVKEEIAPKNDEDDEDEDTLRRRKKPVLLIESIDPKTRHVVIKNISSLPIPLANWKIKNCKYQLAQKFPTVTLPAKETFTFRPRTGYGNPPKYCTFWQSGDHGEIGKDAEMWLYDPEGIVVHQLSLKK